MEPTQYGHIINLLWCYFQLLPLIKTGLITWSRFSKLYIRLNLTVKLDIRICENQLLPFLQRHIINSKVVQTIQSYACLMDLKAFSLFLKAEVLRVCHTG